VLHTGEGQGTYHLAASGETTWHEYALFVIRLAQRLRPQADWRVKTIDPVPTRTFPTPAKRPHNSRLDTTFLKASLGLELPPWQSGVARMLEEVLG